MIIYSQCTPLTRFNKEANTTENGFLSSWNFTPVIKHLSSGGRFAKNIAEVVINARYTNKKKEKKKEGTKTTHYTPHKCISIINADVAGKNTQMIRELSFI